MKLYTLHIFVAGVLSVVCMPLYTYAADFYFENAPRTFSTGENQILLKIKTGGDSLNAVSGRIVIPDGLTIQKISTGSSAILMWIEQPKPDTVISFSGITPGGFQGDVVLFVLGYSGDGRETIKVLDAEAIKNDGLGSIIRSTSLPFFVKESLSQNKSEDKDLDSPEVFEVIFGKDNLLFNGAYFASFIAQDKKTGIEKYEWAHTFFTYPGETDWRKTESPLVLTKSHYIQKLFVRATDGEGNVRVVVADGPYRYAVLWIGIIMILTVLCVLFFVRPSLYRFL